MKRRAVQGFLVALLSATLASAQSTAPHPTHGELPSLKLGPDEEPGNSISAGIMVGASYDDNVLQGQKGRRSDEAYLIRPHFELTHNQSRTHLLLSATPGFTKYQHIPERDRLTGGAETDLRSLLTEHLEMRFRDTFTRTDDPEFDVFNRPATEVGVVDLSPGLIAVPLGKRVSNNSNLEMTYQTSPYGMIDLGGNYHYQHFSPIPRIIGGNELPVQLINNETAGARAAYAYRASERHTVGLMYSFQDLAFYRQTRARTVTDTIFYTHAIAITPKMSFEVFAGPERAHTFNIIEIGIGIGTVFLPVNKTSWSWAGGSTFGWQGNHTSFRASFVRQVGEGGGLLSAVRQQRETLEALHQFTQRWSADVHVSYGENKLLNVFSNAASIRSFVVSVGAKRRITQNVSFRLGYTRAQQDRRGRLLGGSEATDRDRVSVSLEYNFKHPLGR